MESNMNKLIFLIMDVDGTLTDGKIYIGNEGECMKAFHVRDGFGIAHILPLYNIVPVVITARKSIIVANRCKELGISHLYQGINDKLSQLDKILNEESSKSGIKYRYSNCAYIGDDFLDLECMKQIKAAGGVVGCPADAIGKIVEIIDFKSKKNGGDGAVRDFIEWLVERRKGGETDI